MKDEATKQQLYNRLGSDYFWFAGHYALAGMLFERFRPKEGGYLLNIGCGPNEFSPVTETMRYLGADFSWEACRLARSHAPDALIVCCDAHHLPFKNCSIGAVIALELLEHLENDHRAGREFGRVLHPGGKLFVSVPAYAFLWGSHDEWNRHFRRYNDKTLQALAKTARLRIDYRTYYKLAFVVPLWCMRSLKKLTGATASSHDFVTLPRFLNTLLRWCLLIEARIASSVALLAGVSIFSVMTPSEDA